MPRRPVMILAVLTLLGILAAVLPAPDMSAQVLRPPGGGHALGTDELGQDVLLRLIGALPDTLLLALAVGVLPVLFAVILAAAFMSAAGGCRQALLRVVDVAMLLPSALVLTVLAAFVSPGLWGSILLLSALAWLDDYRVLATSLDKENLRENVRIARMYGASRGYLLRAHLLPPLWPVLLALVVQNARRGVMLSAGLVFLGLADPRMPSWGSLMREAQKYMHMDAFWWLLPPPLAALTLLLLALDRLRPARRD